MESNGLWPLVLYAAIVLILVAAMLSLSHILGARRLGPPPQATVEPFESGVLPVGTARLRLSAKFYLIAMFFVIFDLEAVYLFAWAIAVREAGWAGFIEAAVFVFLLVVALAYLWRLGALDWALPRSRTRTR